MRTTHIGLKTSGSEKRVPCCSSGVMFFAETRLQKQGGDPEPLRAFVALSLKSWRRSCSACESSVRSAVVRGRLNRHTWTARESALKNHTCLGGLRRGAPKGHIAGELRGLWVLTLLPLRYALEDA